MYVHVHACIRLSPTFSGSVTRGSGVVLGGREIMDQLAAHPLSPSCTQLNMHHRKLPQKGPPQSYMHMYMYMYMYIHVALAAGKGVCCHLSTGHTSWPQLHQVAGNGEVAWLASQDHCTSTRTHVYMH